MAAHSETRSESPHKDSQAEICWSDPSESSLEDPGREVSAAAQSVICFVSRLQAGETDLDECLPSCGHPRLLQVMDSRVRAALVYLQQGWRSRIRIGQVAAAVSLSPSRLQHLFKQQTGLSMTDYLQYRRVQEALRLLTQTDLRITEICYRIGWESPAHFDHVCRRLIGVSPSEYRRDQQADRGGPAESDKQRAE